MAVGFTVPISVADTISHSIKTAVSFVVIVVFFFNRLFGLSTGTLTPILTITLIWIMRRITISNTRTIRSLLCNRNLQIRRQP